ncbi:MAG: response regulator [Desulfobacteraceae bacterium]|jgi:PAS domain S-box-containing protein
MRDKASSTIAPLHGLTSEQRQMIDAECINMVYDRSLMGMLGSFMGVIVTAWLLWPLKDTRIIVGWLVAMMLVSVARTVLGIQFNKRERDAEETLIWGRWNTICLGITGVLWGMTMIFMFPESSVPHQFCLAVILCCLMAGSGILYSFANGTFVCFSLPIVGAYVIRFAMYSEVPHLTIAGISICFWILMAIAGRSILHARHELLITKYHLMNRVSEGLHEVEHTNTQLQAEILERKEIEENLRQERDRLETITGTIGAGLAVISKDYRIVWANRVFKEMFGSVEGRPCFHTHNQGDKICDDCGARMIFELGYRKISHEQKGQDSEGNTIWFQIITTPIEDGMGQITAALELVLPITERKLAQEKQNKMAIQLEKARKTEAIATLAGGIAHQFNNSLAAIVGNTELLDHDFGEIVDIDEFIQPILSASQRMARLTDQLLAYAHGGKYRPRSADMLEVIQTTLTLIKHTIPEPVKIKTVWGRPPEVTMDVTQMQMVLSAVISNALEAMGQKGRITIHCDRVVIEKTAGEDYGGIKTGECAEIVISDDGIGMDRNTLDRVFEPFFTTKFQGRGLGMAAVYGIVKNHGGHISVASQTNKGTEVRIYLPGTAEQEKSKAESSAFSIADNITILLVEDEQDIRIVNQNYLERSGYTVVTASNGQSAIDIICGNQLKIDLVLLDLKLSDMDGRTLLPYLREHRPSAKVLICSGYGPDDQMEELLDAGVCGFIQKPFTLNELLDKLHEILK